MRLLLSLFLFFPSITFGLLTAEIFPWAILMAAVYVKKLHSSIIYIFILLGLSSFYGLYKLAFIPGMSNDIIRSLATYANVLLVSQYVLSLSEYNINRLAILSKNLFIFLCTFGLLQSVGFDELDKLIKLLIPRGSGLSLSDSGRGVTLLSTEPARAGIELTLIYSIYRLTLLKKNSFHYLDIILILYQVAIIKSSSSVIFSLVFVLILYGNWRQLYLIPFLFILGVGSLSFFEDGRASILFTSLLVFDNFSAGLLFLVNESGNRLLGLYSFFKFGFNHPFGGGVGAWPDTSMLAVLESGFDYTQLRFFDVVSYGALSPFRGPGVISNLMLDVGIVGTCVIFWLFKNLLNRTIGFVTTRHTFAILLIFLIKIFIFGSPGNPVPFIAILVVYRWIYFDNMKKV